MLLVCRYSAHSKDVGWAWLHIKFVGK